MIHYKQNNQDSMMSYSLSSLNINYTDCSDRWISFSPNNLNGYISEDGSFKVTSNYDTQYHIWRAFNHSEDYYADLGILNNINNFKQIYIQFSQVKNIYAFKFKLHDLVNSLKIALSYSLDGKIYEQIDRYLICSQSNQIKDFIYCEDDSLKGWFLEGSPVILCNFKNEQSYKYYKISLIYADYRNPIKISDMFLYDCKNAFYPVIKYPFNSDLNNVNQEDGTAQSLNVSFQNDMLKLDNGFVKINSLYNSKCLTMSFLSKFNEDNIEGTMMHRENDIFNLSCKTISDCICFKAISYDCSIGLSRIAGDSYMNDLYYFIDEGKLVKYEFNFHQDNMINVAQGHTISFIKSSKTFNNLNNQFKFVMTGQFTVSGKLVSLCGFNEIFQHDCIFYRLFEGCNSLIDASMLQLPLTTVTNCYNRMFFNCSNLMKAPYLRSSIMAYQCYKDMFNGCSLLNQIKMEVGHADENQIIAAVDGMLSNVSLSGKLYANSLPYTNFVPRTWQILTLEESMIPVYIQNDKFCCFMIKSKNINNNSLQEIGLFKKSLSQIKGIEHRYTFIFNQNNEKMYFDNQLIYDVDKKSDFNKNNQSRLIFGCDEHNDYINNMFLRSLSFYNFENTILNVKKQIN